jgi:hypothetical protein
MVVASLVAAVVAADRAGASRAVELAGGCG